jgi:hypothetical protein
MESDQHVKMEEFLVPRHDNRAVADFCHRFKKVLDSTQNDFHFADCILNYSYIATKHRKNSRWHPNPLH